MRRLPTAAALAVLLLTAGIAGVVSAEPNSTDYQNTMDVASVATTDAVTAKDARLAATARPVTAQVAIDVPDSDDATSEQQLARRLAQYGLTDAQVSEIVTEASRLEEAGASRLVIRSSIVMNLYEFGVDAPFLYGGADDADRPGDGHAAFHRVIATLDVTPEQARELHAMVHRMMDAGASREEIRRAIAIQLDEWDVDRPRPDGDDARLDGVDRLVDSLVDRYDLDRGQAVELERLIRGMLDSGAHRGEIREAVSRLLHSYGVDDPTPADARVRR